MFGEFERMMIFRRSEEIFPSTFDVEFDQLRGKFSIKQPSRLRKVYLTRSRFNARSNALNL